MAALFLSSQDEKDKEKGARLRSLASSFSFLLLLRSKDKDIFQPLIELWESHWESHCRESISASELLGERAAQLVTGQCVRRRHRRRIPRSSRKSKHLCTHRRMLQRSDCTVEVQHVRCWMTLHSSSTRSNIRYNWERHRIYTDECVDRRSQ
jgi:hypothetical protein